MGQHSKKNNLIWLDLEMTGLNPERDRIIEIAVVVTDSHLNTVAEGPDIAIYQPDAILQMMDEWNVNQHSESGLIERVKASNITEELAQTQILEFLFEFVSPKKSPLCGNSICMDRRFLYRWMPKLEDFLHYRNLDVSTIKILSKIWAPHIHTQIKKESRHRAKDDIYESIEELRFYKEHFLRIGE